MTHTPAGLNPTLTRLSELEARIAKLERNHEMTHELSPAQEAAAYPTLTLHDRLTEPTMSDTTNPTPTLHDRLSKVATNMFCDEISDTEYRWTYCAIPDKDLAAIQAAIREELMRELLAEIERHEFDFGYMDDVIDFLRTYLPATTEGADHD